MKAIFEREFHYSSRRTNAGWSAYPSGQPQEFPDEFIEAGIRAGCARPVTPRRGRKRDAGPAPEDASRPLGEAETEGAAPAAEA